ncbi:MAG: hypothetical protein NTV21_16680 [Planctomycetota bacterium]|nr:hypothetical protein [Planctomycetota bacterium]
MRGIAEPLPEGFELREEAHGWLVSRTDAAAELAQVGFTLDSDGAATSAGLAGRKSMPVLRSSRGELVLRRFTHGGLLRWLTGARFSDPQRPLRELRDSLKLAQAGVRTPEVVAARARRASGWGWELALLTRRVDGARDGGALLERGALPARERARLFTLAGTLVRRLHELGFLHADLHPKNLLFRREPDGEWGAPWVLDLDRSRWLVPLEARERDSNLARLLRYAERRRASGQFEYSRADLLRFLAAYEPRRATRRELASAVVKAYAGSLRWHRLGWQAERA